MDEIRQVLSVVTVLALLGGALWWLRRRGVAQFALQGRGSGKVKAMTVVERLSLTPQHSLHLVRIGERTILVAVSPGGCGLLDRFPEPKEQERTPLS